MSEEREEGPIMTGGMDSSFEEDRADLSQLMQLIIRIR